MAKLTPQQIADFINEAFETDEDAERAIRVLAYQYRVVVGRSKIGIAEAQATAANQAAQATIQAEQAAVNTAEAEMAQYIASIAG